LKYFTNDIKELQKEQKNTLTAILPFT